MGGASGRGLWEKLIFEVHVGGTHMGGASVWGRGLWEEITGGACGRVHYCSLAPNVRMVESGHKTRAHTEAHVGGGRILNQGAHQTFCE